MNHFELVSEYKPTGDQPQAIKKLSDGFLEGNQFETLVGVTGSGKTFTMANIIEKVQKPTLIISHNKTLAAQLYGEMKEFFPNNAVEYFVSYYDYYQSEASIFMYHSRNGVCLHQIVTDYSYRSGGRNAIANNKIIILIVTSRIEYDRSHHHQKEYANRRQIVSFHMIQLLIVMKIISKSQINSS